ncbi:MAG: hypothetical protein ACJ8FV_02490 [Xanthobacteraceae bacterium]
MDAFVVPSLIVPAGVGGGARGSCRTEQAGKYGVVKLIPGERWRQMTSQDERKKPGEADRGDDGGPAKTQSDLRKDGKERRQEPPAGEEITGEGSPGLTITGGSGHA